MDEWEWHLERHYTPLGLFIHTMLIGGAVMVVLFTMIFILEGK